MSYWTDKHPNIPEPEIGDMGTYVSVEIVVNGIKVEFRFETKESAYRFCNAYDKAIDVQGSLLEA